MSRRPAALARGRARSFGLLLAAAVVIPLATGCSAGQVAATALDVSAVEGAGAYRGGLAVLDVRIATPPGGSYAADGDAPLYGAITTDELTTDTLVGIRTDAASGVTLVHAPGGSASPTASASASPSGSASPSVSVSPSAAPSASSLASPAASPSAAASPSGPLNIKIDYGTLQVYQDGSDFLQLQGLTRSLSPGMSVTITFTFANAGDITLRVPVATPNTPEPRPSPSQALSE